MKKKDQNLKKIQLTKTTILPLAHKRGEHVKGGSLIIYTPKPSSAGCPVWPPFHG